MRIAKRRCFGSLLHDQFTYLESVISSSFFDFGLPMLLLFFGRWNGSWSPSWSLPLWENFVKIRSTQAKSDLWSRMAKILVVLRVKVVLKPWHHLCRSDVFEPMVWFQMYCDFFSINKRESPSPDTRAFDSPPFDGSAGTSLLATI